MVEGGSIKQNFFNCNLQVLAIVLESENSRYTCKDFINLTPGVMANK